MRTRRAASECSSGTNRFLATGAVVAAGLLLLASTGHATGLGVRGSVVSTPDDEENARMMGGFVRIGSMFAVEGAVDYRSTDIGPAEVKTWPVTASLVVSPIPFAYGLAGVGWYNTTLDLPPELAELEVTEREFGYHAGAGVRFPLAPVLSFVGDLRYSYVGYDFDEFTDTVAEFDGGDYVALNLGLMFELPGA
ncbi:MAG TPA: outer membrane beta-barrel protein [bacterium]|nr:outer membrane beta-barrel protein [bacterium]